MSKQNIYDNEQFFENFKNIRKDEFNYNDNIETPILLSMLPELRGKTVLDIGCGMGQHAKQYVELGAKSVLGIDISEKMLAFAKENNCAENIVYKQLAMEDISTLEDKFDIVTSSLVFDYIEDLDELMKNIYSLMNDNAKLVFSMSHPIATAYDGTYPRWTRGENNKRLYANLNQYCVEGLRKITWAVDGVECYHKTISSIINAIIKAGFQIEECKESMPSDEMMRKAPNKYDGTIHRPDFIFFQCRK